jgi:tetratricopeptide (TPR) repeat protein
MPIPVCFMVMPFGKKLTNAEADKAPGQIDFDLLWDKVLRPMIQDGLKHIPVRADQDAGALIIQAMIERLAISDLVIAELTIPNANVYYEVGVRHAAQKQGCVLIAADWSKPLFDVSQMRRVKYPLPDGAISDEAAAAIRKILEVGIQQSIDHTSPVFQAIPGYPDRVGAGQLQSFRDVACKLATFQSEVSVARGLPAALAAEHAQRLVHLYAEDAVAVPSVALDLTRLLRDTQRWDDALKFIDGLSPRIRELPIMREQRALALGKNGQHIQAISELEAIIRTDGDTSERSGLLAGRYKALYDHAHNAESKSIYLNKTITCYERAMMLDLNDYFPPSNLPRLYRERKRDGDEKKAMVAVNVALVAGERSRRRNPADPWVAPTLLGAAFDSGDIPSAERLLAEMNEEVAPPFYIQSTIPDLRRSLSLLNDTKTSAALAAILAGFQRLLDPNGTVLALAGRRIDAEGADERRFPPGNEALVAARIRNMMVSTTSQAVVCSAACGADILALESAAQLGLSRRVVLPCAREQFRSTSVADRGEDWGRRFDTILQQLQSKDIVELNLQSGNDEAYAAVNSKILDEAARWASITNRRALAAVIWNGFSRGATDLTDAFRRLAVDRKLETIFVPTL